jgi:gamma-glutamyltranspeptidase/glutathione hydrolase
MLPDPPVVAPLKGSYRGWDVYTLPPPFGGWVVLQVLQILEEAPGEQLAPASPERLVWLAEALRIGHRSRRERPIHDLRDYDESVADRLDPRVVEQHRAAFRAPDSSETTHFSVVDRTGMAVAATASVNGFFGAKVAHPRLGFLYNSYMHDFVITPPDHPFVLAPRAMAYSSMSATILARDGKVGLVLGSPGSKRIISTVVQVISHWVDGGEGLARAVAAPRVHVIGEDRLLVEDDGISATQLARLERRGFRVSRPLSSLSGVKLNPYFGGVHAVARESSGWQGAADPRRDGRTAGSGR